MKKFALAVMLLISFSLHAEQRAYVTDKLEVQMRAGQGTQFRAVKMLASGTPLKILKSDEASGYSRVLLDSGEQGWVLTRYLTDQPGAQIQMEANAKRLAELEAENATLKSELGTLRTGKDASDKTSQDMSSEAERLNSELISIRKASANVIQIQNERDQLQERVINLERELETTRREKQAQDADDKQDWFLIGAGVLFGGIALGVVLPRLSWRKRASWDSF